MLYDSDGRKFAAGQMPYRDHVGDIASLPRIVIITIIEDLPVEAALDTGGSFLVCDPELVEWLGLRPGTGIATASLSIRGVSVNGELHRVTMTLEAQTGENVDVEVTAFAPALRTEQIWDLPVILGLQGCLEFIRFAVDPGTNTFYFGTLDA